MPHRLRIERDESRDGLRPSLPFFNDPVPRDTQNFLSELSRVAVFCRRKVPPQAFSSPQVLKDDDLSLKALLVGSVYVHQLHLVRAVSVSDEEDLKRLVSAGVRDNPALLVNGSRGADLFSTEEHFTTLLSPLARLPVIPSHLETLPWKRIHAFLTAHDFSSLGWDAVGLAYLSLQENSSRKKQGSYHTPVDLVERMVDRMDLEHCLGPDFQVMDPACGSGMFLLGVARRIYQHYVSQGMEHATAWIRAMGSHILGFDNNPVAVALGHMNFLLRTPTDVLTPPPLYEFDPLLSDENLFADARLRRRWENGADFIIGNPPWRPLRKGEQVKYQGRFISAHGRQANLFSLFLEAGLKVLKPGGGLLFLLPEALLNVQSYEPLRRHVVRQADFTYLAQCGNVWRGILAPAAVVGLVRKEKESAPQEGEVTIVQGLLDDEPRERRAPAPVFLSTPEQIFNYLYDEDLEESCRIIGEGGPRAVLKDHAEWALGIVTGNNAKYIAEKKIDHRYEPILIGKDVDRYRIDYSDHWILYDHYELQQAAPEEFFRAPEKLIYKFIGNRLRFAYDDKGMLTLNNLNLLIPTMEDLDIFCLLGLLNSSVLQFYHAYRYFTVKVLRSRLETLPLALPGHRERERLAELVRKAVADARRPESFAALDRRIDDLVFDFYGIDDLRADRIRLWLGTRCNMAETDDDASED